MLFVQSFAPRGWTKLTTQNDKALRIVSGTASTGGTLAFSTVFARTATDAATAGTTDNTTSTGNANSTTSTGTVANATSTGTVGDTSLSTAQLATHPHSVPTGESPGSGGTTAFLQTSDLIDVPDANTGSTGSGSSHTHSLTMNAHNHSLTMNGHTHTLTMNAHNHTFTATHTHGMDIRVQYVDVIQASKN